MKSEYTIAQERRAWNVRQEVLARALDISVATLIDIEKEKVEISKKQEEKIRQKIYELAKE